MSYEILYTAQEIAHWKEDYTIIERTEDYFLRQYNTDFARNAASFLVVQQNVVKALAQLYICKDDLEVFDEAYDALYRWVLRSDDMVIPAGKYQTFDKLIADFQKEQDFSTVLKLPSNYKLMLQLRINGRWKDWVYIAKSHRVNAHYGLFSARDFCSNTMIGFYMGPVKWEASIEGGYEASSDELEAAGVIDSEYSLQLRNKDCRCVVVDPVSIRAVDDDEIQTASLYMGMHYMNNPCLTFEKGTTSYFNARKDQNCLLLEDGCVQAIRKIKPNTELLTGYHSDQLRPRKQMIDRDESVGMDIKPTAKKSIQQKKHTQTQGRTMKPMKKAASKPVGTKYVSKKNHTRSESKVRKLPARSASRDMR
jgi:hypothetical protein